MTGVKRSFATAMGGEEVSTRPPDDSCRELPGEGRWETSRSLDATSPPTKTEPFQEDVSIVLVGIRGAGKSTLAIIASTALKRPIIDCENAFQQATGVSSSEFKRVSGSAECNRLQAEVLSSVLNGNTNGAIIVCSWIDLSVQVLLRRFSCTNPVIHILRDVKAIRQYLKIDDEAKVHNLLRATSTIFRGCSNYEFFNVSENSSDPRVGSPEAARSPKLRSATPYLTLKRAERHFLKFLSLIMPDGTMPFIESAFPLASIPTEKRCFTYAVSVRLSALLQSEVDIEALEIGADAIEIVVDDMEAWTDVNVQKHTTHPSPERASEIAGVIGFIRRSTVIPIIYHVLPPERISASGLLQRCYIEYAMHGLRLAPEYLTLDLALDESLLPRTVSAKKRSHIIGNMTFITEKAPSWTDPAWIIGYRKAQRLCCDLVRFMRPAGCIDDNFEVSQLRAAAGLLPGTKIPIIAYNSGLLGRNSACFNQIMTLVAPDGSDASGATPGEPAITAFQATKTLYSSFIYEPMKLYVFGANVSYSLSPAMHNAALQACGIPHHYQPASTDSLSKVKDLIEDPNFAGASVGLPFKVEIITLTHSLSRHAKAIGAVNTLIPIRQLGADGSVPEDETLFNCRNRTGPVIALYGENTDWIGIRASIRRGLSPANAVRPSSCALIVGAGGMARAAVYAMLQLGVKNVVIYNRTFANAEKLVSHFTTLLQRDALPFLSAVGEKETRFHILESLEAPWPDTFRLPTMIISCIPTHKIGDVPAPDFTVPSHWLGSSTGGVVMELAYKTLNTPLLEQVRREAHRGWVAMDGLDLLPEQGFAQFELFTGRRAPRRLMRREVFRAYPEEEGGTNLAQLQPRLESIVEQEP